jgi:hypothetical protein
MFDSATTAASEVSVYEPSTWQDVSFPELSLSQVADQYNRTYQRRRVMILPSFLLYTVLSRALFYNAYLHIDDLHPSFIHVSNRHRFSTSACRLLSKQHGCPTQHQIKEGFVFIRQNAKPGLIILTIAPKEPRLDSDR